MFREAEVRLRFHSVLTSIRRIRLRLSNIALMADNRLMDKLSVYSCRVRRLPHGRHGIHRKTFR